MPAPLALIEDAPGTDERVIALRGEIDVGTTPALRDWLDRATARGTRSVAVDLTNVQFMAISGLYVLCDEQARMARSEARLTVVCNSKRILKLFAICRLHDALRIVATRAELGTADVWGDKDDQRSARLDAWLERYSASSA